MRLLRVPLVYLYGDEHAHALTNETNTTIIITATTTGITASNHVYMHTEILRDANFGAHLPIYTHTLQLKFAIDSPTCNIIF